ncbi:MAG: Asd/ArgC dimerization domain-containing protein [Nannocystaceae bacterium]|nr:Asd/ArgC dimerization domain-containing protein [bacterium]
MDPRIATHRDPTPDAIDAFRDCRAVALAIPEGPAVGWTEALRAAGIRVLDLSGAHRQTEGIHYGIPELWGAPDADATVVANPGCYPTATLLALVPLLRGGAVEASPLAVVGASGTSGAGKGLRDDLHFSALFGNTFPYKVGAHRHIPEISRHLGAPVTFVTQLLPIVRGILVTAFVRPTRSAAHVLQTLQAFYADQPYVSVLPEPGPGCGVAHVVGSHQAVLAVGPADDGGLVPVFATIDNLMRGAASQALANLNLWLGLPAESGLPTPLQHVGNDVPPMPRALP